MISHLTSCSEKSCYNNCQWLVRTACNTNWWCACFSPVLICNTTARLGHINLAVLAAMQHALVLALCCWLASTAALAKVTVVVSNGPSVYATRVVQDDGYQDGV